MPVPAAHLNRRVTFQRRAVVPTAPGVDRAGFQSFGVETWAGYKDGRMAAVDVGGMEVMVPSGVLTLRESPFALSLTGAEQVLIDKNPFQVLGPALPERATGTLKFGVQGVPTRSAFATAFDTRGEVVTLRRIRPNVPDINVVVRAIITGYMPEELVAGIVQGERKVWLSAQDLEAQSFPEPVAMNDRIIMRGPKTLNVISVDASSGRVGGLLLAYFLRAAG